MTKTQVHQPVIVGIYYTYTLVFRKKRNLDFAHTYTRTREGTIGTIVPFIRRYKRSTRSIKNTKKKRSKTNDLVPNVRNSIELLLLLLNYWRAQFLNFDLLSRFSTN